MDGGRGRPSIPGSSRPSPARGTAEGSGWDRPGSPPPAGTQHGPELDAGVRHTCAPGPEPETVSSDLAHSSEAPQASLAPGQALPAQFPPNPPGNKSPPRRLPGLGLGVPIPHLKAQPGPPCGSSGHSQPRPRLGCSPQAGVQPPGLRRSSPRGHRAGQQIHVPPSPLLSPESIISKEFTVNQPPHSGSSVSGSQAGRGGRAGLQPKQRPREAGRRPQPRGATPDIRDQPPPQLPETMTAAAWGLGSGGRGVRPEVG